MLSIGVILYIALIVFIIASFWKVYEKAGQPGWAAIIPIYNFYILSKITGVKNWWLIFIPIANIYILFVMYIALAKSFGKDTGFGIGLIFLGLHIHAHSGLWSGKVYWPQWGKCHAV